MPNAPTRKSEQSRSIASQRERLATLNREAERFTRVDVQKGLALANEALTISRMLNDIEAEAKSRLNIAYACFRLFKYDEALSHVKQAHKIWSQLGNSEKERETLHCLGNIYTMTSNYALAKEHYNNALTLSRTLKDKRAEACALTNLGSLSEKEGNFIDALHFSKESLKLLRDIGDKNAEAATLRNIGVMYEKLSDYSTALSYYRQSLALREEINDQRGIARCLNSIGIVYYRQINRAAAIEAFEKCLAIFRHIGDRYDEAMTLSYIGSSLIDDSRYDDALAALDTSLALRREIQDRRGEAVALTEIGKLHLKAHRLGFATKHLNKGLEVFLDIGDKYKVSETLGLMAELYFMQKKIEQGIKALQEAIRIAEQIQARASLANLHRKAAEIYTQLEDHAKALKHFKRFYELDKEIFNEESDKRLKVLQMQFEVERKEKENETLRQELSMKEKALRTITRFLIEEAETQTEMKMRLMDIKEQVATGAFEAIEKRLSAMERKMNPEKTWEVFEREFREAHPEFMTYLSRRFPTLSPTEMKVCAMLKLAHSTKEIAQLLFITVSTVLEHRSNIRRKLNLSAKDNLTAFITRL